METSRYDLLLLILLCEETPSLDKHPFIISN